VIDVMRPPIIFVGMHRSGTSMLAGLLKKMGVFLGYGVQHNESIFLINLIYISKESVIVVGIIQNL